MKHLSLNNRKVLFGAASVILMLAFLMGLKYSLDSSKPYVPENTVSVMDNERSQVYVGGEDYKLDTHMKTEHKQQQQKRNKILEQRRVSRQQKPQQKRAEATRPQPRRQPAPVRPQQGKPVKKPEKKEEPKKEEPKKEEPAEPDDPGNGEPDDDVPDDENKKPTITTSLKDGQSMQGEAVNFWVTATDYNNQNIPVFSNGEGHFEVYLNESKLTSTGASGDKTNFRAEVQDGENTIRIVATDKDGTEATRTVKIRCDTNEEGKIIGSVTVSASAPSLGIGTIFSGQKVDITEQMPLNEILKVAFSKQGISAEMSSSYLAGLKKGGIAKNAKITDELRDKAAEKRVTLYEREDWPDGWQNRLREKDFCSHSGWTYYVNGSMPGVGIGSYVPDDGDEIQLVFILFDGDR